MLFKLRQGSKLKRAGVGAFKNDGGRYACSQRVYPACGTQAPAIAGFQAFKAVFWPGGHEVIAMFDRKSQKLGSDPGADQV